MLGASASGRWLTAEGRARGGRPAGVVQVPRCGAPARSTPAGCPPGRWHLGGLSGRGRGSAGRLIVQPLGRAWGLLRCYTTAVVARGERDTTAVVSSKEFCKCQPSTS